MIASLKGIVEAKYGRELVLGVQGVGYQVQVTKDCAGKFTIGDPAHLQIAHIIREDAQLLFGFEHIEQKRLFDSLRSVTGVGPRTAIAVLDGNTPAQIALAVANDDDALFRAVPGIGPKTAKLMVVSLAGKLSTIAVGDDATVESKDSSSDVIAALVGLGWPVAAATPVVGDVLKLLGANASTAEALKLSISKLGAK